MSILSGKAWKFGHDINTDYISPHSGIFDMMPWEERWEAMGKAAMSGTPPELGDPDFAKKMDKGDFIVAGKNFGSGSSREEGALNIKAAGTGAVIAESFARIWYRNAINNGLIALEVEGVSEKVNQGDELEVDVEKGWIINLSTKEKINIKPLPKFIRDMMDKGGLIPSIKERLRAQKGE